MIRVSIVVPTYNRADFLRKCITSLLAQEFPKETFEILVVDDGSTDATPQMMSELIEKATVEGYQLRYLRQENQGPAVTRNRGWQNARGEIIAFTDDDCIASPHWLEEITNGYETRDIAGVCGNVFAVQTENIVSQFLAQEKLHESPFYDKYGQIVYPITCNASFRRSVLELVNGFDETFPYPGGEDVDLGIQIRKRGYFFIDNRQAIINHYHKFTLRSLLRTWYRYGIGGALWQLKNSARLFSVCSDERGLNYWLINYPDALSPMKAILLQIARIANLPRDIYQYQRNGISLGKSIVYFSLKYARDTMYHIGLIIGYHRYKEDYLK
ncbi:MAG: glycosyltransferase [bacterium]|nr:glycosyltransferase [bacterium]